MEIKLSKEQILFLIKVKELHDADLLCMPGPWRRISNIVKNGVYYDDKDSWYQPPVVSDENDREILNLFTVAYKKTLT